MAENLSRLLTDHPFAEDEPLLHGERASMTKGEALARTDALASALHDLGTHSGDPVAVVIQNRPEAVTTIMGVWQSGGVLVPINPRISEGELDGVLAATGAGWLVRDAEDPRSGIVSLGAERRYESDTAFILWTSGTTGRPKPILHSHHGYLELLDRMIGPLRGSPRPGSARRPAPNLIPVPLALNSGLYNMLFGLRAGAALVIMERFDPKTFAELVQRFEIRSTVLPPAAIVALNGAADVDDLTPLHYVRSITAPLSPLQARRFTDRFGAFVLNGYGQAEIGEVIGWTAADARRHPERLGAAGKPHPGVAVKVLDDSGERAAPGSVGCLWVRAPSMASGYAGGEELGDRLDSEGYLDTGDLASIDDAGFVWLEGRASDLINRGGNKVFPEEVEEILCLVPGITQAAVVAASDERLGEVPVAYLVSDEPLDEAALAAHCRQRLVPYKIPVAFVRIDELPRNEAGKLLRRQLRAGVVT